MSTNSSSPVADSTDTAASGVFSTGRIGGFGYGVGVSVGILLLITTITLASYFCTRANTDPSRSSHGRAARAWPPRSRNTRQSAGVDEEDLELGIDEATLKTYPELLYAEAKRLMMAEKESERGDDDGNKASSWKAMLSSATAACCSVCLADYKDTDVLRVLPDCGHMFHVACVDPWLRSRPTCPVCRASPLPSPMATPLVEVVPLARQQRL